jgi:hypothetical protein
MPRNLEVKVETRRLVDFGFQNVTLIKRDVEGHALSVPRGDMTFRPALLIELEKSRHLGQKPIDNVKAKPHLPLNIRVHVTM